jgi:hypothetical protein
LSNHSSGQNRFIRFTACHSSRSSLCAALAVNAARKSNAPSLSVPAARRTTGKTLTAARLAARSSDCTGSRFTLIEQLLESELLDLALKSELPKVSRQSVG